jgi:uncharacterized protein YycO
VATIERYGPGEQAREFTPGDFILTHRRNPISALISFGEKRRFHGADASFAHWSHCALVVAPDGSVVEPETTGVKKSPIARYRSSEYHLVRLDGDLSEAGRERAVDYADAQVGQAFGYLALAGAAIYLVTGWPLHVMRRNHQVCSGMVTRALQKGGLLRDFDPATTLPADLAKAFSVRP